MSEEQMEQQEHSAEEKFFGVKTVIGKKPDDEGQDPDIDVEVVDDRPPEDRRPPAKEAKPEPSDDEELEGYSDKVKKRINKLRYQQHEERRQREEAERLREEAIRVAQKYADQASSTTRSFKKASSIWFIRYESELLWLSIKLKIAIGRLMKRVTPTKY